MTGPQSSPWLVEIASAPRAGRDEVFYAVPHAGAGAAAVRDLSRRIGRHATAVAVRLPAREARLYEEPLRDVHLIAEQAADALVRHAAGRPITVYGHCSGAVVAFEIVRRLADTDVRTLFVSAHEPPDRIPRDGVWRWPLGPFIRRVAADGYVPDFILEDDELLELLVPALRADYEAIETYRSEGGARIGAAVVGFLGTADTTVVEPDFRGWSGFTTGGLELHRLPGGHNLLLDHTDDVADAIISRSGWD
ncbi:thioesterase domain-containing protein [Streptomyces sp. NBC_00433]